MHTILFDIDGTLIHSGGAGQAGIERVLAEEFGVTAPTFGISTAGRTDRGIARDLIRFHQLAESEATYERMLQAYLRILPIELQARDGGTYPGVRDLLNRLSQRRDVRLGLLTGNYREAAWQKLRHFELDHHFEFGGFGDDHADRDDVARQALAAAHSHAASQSANNASINTDHIWVIGDTPADVQCGRAIGARVIAVATGIHSRAELEPTQPDHLFDDLHDVAAVLNVWPEL
jgi:phosphoglycolate phosphatase